MLSFFFQKSMQLKNGVKQRFVKVELYLKLFFKTASVNTANWKTVYVKSHIYCKCCKVVKWRLWYPGYESWRPFTAPKSLPTEPQIPLTEWEIENVEKWRNSKFICGAWYLFHLYFVVIVSACKQQLAIELKKFVHTFWILFLIVKFYKFII